MAIIEYYNGYNHCQLAVGNPTKQACIASTTSPLSAISTVTNVVYDNGVNGTNATLTISTTPNTILVIDNWTAVIGDRILVKDQANPIQNGIYVFSTYPNVNPVILTRALDYNSTSQISRFDVIYVMNGTTNGNTLWSMGSLGGSINIIIGTNQIPYVRTNLRNTVLNYNNLSELTNFATARANLNLYTPQNTTGSNLIISYDTNNMIATYSLSDQLEALGSIATNGIIVKTETNTFSSRTITSGTAINVINGNGVSGNPTISLGTVPIANLNGYPATTNSFLRGDGTWTLPSINNLNINGDISLGIYNLYTSGNLGASGTMYANILQSYNTGNITLYSLLNANNNSITNVANGVSAGDAVNFGQALTNPIYSGTGAMTIVKGTTAQRPTGVSGMMRWNSTLSQYEGYTGSAWVNFVTGTPTVYVSSVAVTGSTGLTVSGTPITNSGTISLTLGAELQGLSSLSTNGFAVRTASGTYASRTLTTTTGSNSLSITNGNGVSGNPQISLSGTAGITTTGNGSFGNVTATGEITAPNVNTNALAPSTNPTITTGALTITAGVSTTFSFGFLNSSGTTGTASGTNFYSVLATYRIKASEFNAVSSIKKKTILAKGLKVELEVIELLKKTEFFKYEYKDKIVEQGVRYGIIAEELAKTLPNYVDNDNLEFIPNIYQNAVVKSSGNNYILYLDNVIDIDLEGNRLRLLDTQNKDIIVDIIEIVANDKILVKTDMFLPNSVFVYGTYEKCPSVASKVSELSLIAIKNLISRIEKLEKSYKNE